MQCQRFSKTEFDWFKFPFLSVNKNAEKITVETNTVPKKLQTYYSDSELYYKDINHQLSTFKEVDNDDCTERKRFGDRKVQDGPCYQHVRSLSASAACRNMFILKERQRRKTVQEKSTTSDAFVKSSFRTSGKKTAGSKSIASEVEMRRNRSQSFSIKSSINSLASSTTTISSYSSVSTAEVRTITLI